MFKRTEGRVTCLIIYVDDMIIIGDDTEEVSQLMRNLFQQFDMKDVGEREPQLFSWD